MKNSPNLHQHRNFVSYIEAFYRNLRFSNFSVVSMLPPIIKSLYSTVFNIQNPTIVKIPTPIHRGRCYLPPQYERNNPLRLKTTKNLQFVIFHSTDQREIN
ncbi:CLUMA_CG018349, isoform A [Clunio marinus]|uniref:CLUMA_CG018349, isoform A n=1 Tax=Clunio marinus TaxID=568069 RepID=A0A1J1IY86_9DIPT|nr:CLUMA_CG018349, isoform A [Clunio marinus]